MMASFFALVAPYLTESNMRVKAVTFGLLLGVILLIANFIYVTGGTHLPYVHVMYVPLIIAGFWLGIRAGFVLALIAGLVLGPYMPMVGVDHIMQSTENWLVRLFFFALITLLTGFGSQITRAYIQGQKRRYLIDFEAQCWNYRGLEARYKIEEMSQNLTGAIAVKVSQARQIEKAFGSEALGSVMHETKGRLQAFAGPGVTIGRIAFDTFLLCLEDDRKAPDFALSLVHHLDKSYRFNKISFIIETYIGIAQYDSEQDEPFKKMVKEGLIAVDVAMENRTEIHVYDHNTKDSSNRNIFLMHALREAIRSDTLSLHYQPQICLQTGDVIGVEALARWNHSDLGVVSPLEFTGLAEQTQLINPYTKWLLKKSLSHLAAWRQRGLDIMLSLNFSMKNFEDPSVVQEIYKFLKEFNIPPHALQLEVTETAVAQTINNAADILHSIRERGVRIAIDDFGMGQSSLAYLFQLPVDVIKIDQSFIQHVLENSAADAIVRSAITMGHEMNLKVVAEGIETQEQYDHLKTLGCDVGQGYYMARPMPREMLETWWETKQKQLGQHKVNP